MERKYFKIDTEDKEELLKYLQDFSKSICNLLREKNKSIKTITLKYKTSSFENHTRSKTLNDYINRKKIYIKVANEILNEEEVFMKT